MVGPGLGYIVCIPPIDAPYIFHTIEGVESTDLRRHWQRIPAAGPIPHHIPHQCDDPVHNMTIWSRPEPANGLGGCRSMSICSILVPSPWNRLAIFQRRVAKSYPHLFVPNRSELSVAVKANNAKAAKSKVDTSPQHYIITCLAIPDWAISTTFPWMHVATCRVFPSHVHGCTCVERLCRHVKFWTCCKSSTYQIKDLYVKPRNLRLALHACLHLESIVFLVLRNAIKKGTWMRQILAPMMRSQG